MPPHGGDHDHPHGRNRMTDTATTGTEGEPQGSEGTGEQNTPTIEDLQAEIESLKGHSRKWEDRAKANKEAADKLTEIEREKMTDAQRAEAERSEIEQRATSAEERATNAEAALARLQIVHEFELTQDDTSALEGITDPDTLRKIAERLAGRSTTQPPKPNPAQGTRTGAGATTNGERFAAVMEGLFS